MKKFLLSLITIFTLFNSISAQEKVILGYCEDKLGGSVSAQADQPHEYGAAIYLKSDILNKYAGSTINRIDFAICQKSCNVMTVFVTRDLNAEPLCTAKISNIQEGWNSVQLNKTYTIKENDNLYVGYRFFTTEQTLKSKVMTFDYTPGTTPGANWFSEDNKWWKFDSNAINFDLAIRAFAEGSGLPKNDVGIKDIKLPKTIVCGKPYDYRIKMRNFGTESIKKIKYNILSNAEIYDTKELTCENFTNNKEQEFTLKGISFPKEGNNKLSIDIIEVNGHEDKNREDNISDALIYCINENSSTVKRKVLFEEFTTEKDESSIKSDSVYKIAKEKVGDVIWIKHHLSGDKFFIEKESSYNVLFENNKPFYPGIMIDRNSFGGLEERGPAYFVGHEDIVADLLNISKSIVSYVLPGVRATYDNNSRTAKININIKPEVIEMPFQTDLRITAYVVEDNILTSTQKGSDKYIQNGVIRKIITDEWGDKIDISKGECNKELECVIPEEWNEQNIRIVAFVNNYNPKDPLNNIIYNSCETVLETTAGINETRKEEENLRVWYDGNTIRVSKGFEITGIYDLSGREIQNITDGLYIVKAKSQSNNELYRKITIH